MSQCNYYTQEIQLQISWILNEIMRDQKIISIQY